MKNSEIIANIIAPTIHTYMQIAPANCKKPNWAYNYCEIALAGFITNNTNGKIGSFDQFLLGSFNIVTDLADSCKNDPGISLNLCCC